MWGRQALLPQQHCYWTFSRVCCQHDRVGTIGVLSSRVCYISTEAYPTTLALGACYFSDFLRRDLFSPPILYSYLFSVYEGP